MSGKKLRNLSTNCFLYLLYSTGSLTEMVGHGLSRGWLFLISEVQEKKNSEMMVSCSINILIYVSKHKRIKYIMFFVNRNRCHIIANNDDTKNTVTILIANSGTFYIIKPDK